MKHFANRTKLLPTTKTLDPRRLLSGSEDGLQRAVMSWSALNAKRLPELKWLWHCPNGGSRDPKEGARMKALGVKRGVPDLALDCARRGYHGLRIELKVGNGKESEDQLNWHAWLTSQGYLVATFRTYDETIAALEWYLAEGE